MVLNLRKFKTYIMKYLFPAIIISISLFNKGLIAQNFQGIAYYQTKTTTEFNFENTRIPPDRQERIKEMMKKQGEKVYELSFTNSESIYKEEEQLDQPGNRGGGRMRFFGGMSTGKLYKNTKLKNYTQQQNLMGKEFLIVDSLKIIDWKMQDESKMIGKYLCFKATSLKTINTNNFRFGRPSADLENEDDGTKEIEITAWYTVDIPVNQGPGKYWGLPGLILEISAGNVQIVCSKITINPKEKLEIKPFTKGKEVNEEKYNQIRKEKMEEMRENRGRNRDLH